MATNSTAYTRARALALVGRPNADRRSGTCLKTMRSKVANLPAIGDWDHDGDPDAEDAWKACLAADGAVRVTRSSAIPPNRFVMWGGGSHDNGHIAYHLNDGHIVTTDHPRSGYVGRWTIDALTTGWNLPLLGWLTHWPDGTLIAHAETATSRIVTNRTGLGVRAEPRMSAPKQSIARRGQKLAIIDQTTINGHTWLLDTRYRWILKWGTRAA